MKYLASSFIIFAIAIGAASPSYAATFQFTPLERHQLLSVAQMGITKSIIPQTASREAPVLTGFTHTFGAGSTQRGEIKQLQQFLIDQGYQTFVTGDYLSLTKAAVSAFQKDYGIKTTGYFGPQTRALVNGILSPVAQASAKPKAMITTQSVTSQSNSAGIILALAKTIVWEAGNYPSGIGVDINLLQKVSDSPAAYVLVRKIATNISNAGSYSWSPASGQTGKNFYIEVTCTSGGYEFSEGCRAGKPIVIN